MYVSIFTGNARNWGLRELLSLFWGHSLIAASGEYGCRLEVALCLTVLKVFTRMHS